MPSGYTAVRPYNVARSNKAHLHTEMVLILLIQDLRILSQCGLGVSPSRATDEPEGPLYL